MDPLYCVPCDYKYKTERVFHEHLTKDKHFKNTNRLQGQELEEKKNQINALMDENRELRERKVQMELVARNLATKAVVGTSQAYCEECEPAGDYAVMTEVEKQLAMAEINFLRQEVQSLRAGAHVVQLEAELAACKMNEEAMLKDVALLKEKVQNLVDEFEEKSVPVPNPDWRVVQAKEISATLELMQIKSHMKHLLAEKQSLEEKMERFIKQEMKKVKRLKRKSVGGNDEKKARMDVSAMNVALNSTILQTSSTPLDHLNTPKLLPQPSCSTIHGPST